MSISRDRHVSFGPAIPILCFDFGIRDGRDGANEFDPFQMYLRMSFHSHWDPEDAIVQQSVEQEGVNFF